MKTEWQAFDTELWIDTEPWLFGSCDPLDCKKLEYQASNVIVWMRAAALQTHKDKWEPIGFKGSLLTVHSHNLGVSLPLPLQIKS